MSGKRAKKEWQEEKRKRWKIYEHKKVSFYLSTFDRYQVKFSVLCCAVCLYSQTSAHIQCTHKLIASHYNMSMARGGEMAIPIFWDGFDAYMSLCHFGTNLKFFIAMVSFFHFNSIDQFGLSVCFLTCSIRFFSVSVHHSGAANVMRHTVENRL